MARARMQLLVAGATILALAAACEVEPGTADVDARVEPADEEPAKILVLDPPEDRARSPYTGWTRAHYEAVFARLLLGYVRHRSSDWARTRYPGGERLPAAMEGAIRLLPALGAWLACPCNPRRVRIQDGARSHEIDVWALARTIVAHGTDPRSRDYWGPIGKGWDQRKVEAATVAEFLLQTRASVWERLDLDERARILRWLRVADQSLAANWIAFQIARNSARIRLGARLTPGPEGERAALDEQLDLLEADYAGDGFYRDGGAHRFDWYNAFVIHPLLTLWRSELGDSSGEAARARAARLAGRTRAFLGHFPYLMDARGAVVPIGRSLAYRSAVLAALHASVLAGDAFVAPGLARRMSAGNLRFHLEAGMFDAHSVLTRGHHGSEPGVLERYLRPGSQYFMTHALAPLALPPSDPFWAATEQALPADRGDFVHVIPAVGWTLVHDREGAGLVLHNARAGTGKAAYHDRYKKLSYAASSWYAHPAEEGAPRPYDAAVVSAAAGRFEHRRTLARAWAVAPGFAWTRYAIAPEGPSVGTLEPGPHWISTAVLSAPAPASVGAGGPEPSVRLSCLAPSSQAPARPYAGTRALRGAATGQGAGEDPLRPWWYLEAGSAVLAVGLSGWTRAGPVLDFPGPATHVLGGPASWVGLGVDGPLEEPRCFASLEQQAGAPFDPQAVLAALPEVELQSTRARLRFADGGLAWVELGRELRPRAVDLGAVQLSGPLRMASTRESGERRELVAHGLLVLRDPSGLQLRSLEPRVLACSLEPGALRCEVDGVVSVRLPGDPGHAELRWHAPTWTGRESSDVQATRVEASTSGWLRLEPPTSETSTMILELEFG